MNNRPIDSATFVRYSGDESEELERPLVREAPWTIHVNGQELVTLLCTPDKMNFMVLGFLAAEGLISSVDEVDLLQVCQDQEGVIDVMLSEKGDVTLPSRLILLSGCGRGITFDDLSANHAKLDSPLTVSPKQISALMRELRHKAEIHRIAGGTHASALADDEGLLVVAEDVGRHNTLDKIRGECMFRGIPTKDHLLLTTGRVSSEMVNKAVKMEVPIVASLTSPTDLAIKLAQAWDMTIVGYVRGSKMNVYTRPDRVVPDSPK
ncbi:MAG: formate dehydrogenase accessory sulfurtransferase FdhD [Anaerolineae bacterium]|nr:formate dehydrogenase accessory sulfurtransferase FdhD [Anaerolineae bacterium]NIQ78176.1 formate dehydrogenase accessory sulfurtransferase FdhD [Anaerolineae bacterium]